MAGVFMNLVWTCVFIAVSVSVGIILILASTLVIPKLIDKLPPNIDEDKEIARGNRAVAEYFGRISAALFLRSKKNRIFQIMENLEYKCSFAQPYLFAVSARRSARTGSSPQRMIRPAYSSSALSSGTCDSTQEFRRLCPVLSKIS